MINKNMLEDLVKSYDREGAWDKLEALYIAAIGLGGFTNARLNIKIRYGSDEPVKEVERDIERLCGERTIPSRTDDTDEEVRKILATACEQTFPEILTRKVDESVPPLSKITKRFVFLFYKEGNILTGGIREKEDTVVSQYTVAYKIIFGEEMEKSEDAIVQEMIKAGLVYDCTWSSRRFWYPTLTVPPFAREVWSKLPEIIIFPTIEVNEQW